MPENAEYSELKARLAEYLSAGRVEHSENVSRAARELAGRFAPEYREQAELAGLLHDNAKPLGDTEMLDLAHRLEVPVTPGERRNPGLLHGKVGAELLPERFGVEDSKVKQAIADHVTGRVGMPMLSQLLFVADQVAAGRSFEGVEQLRETARHDLLGACLHVAKHKLVYIVQKERLIEPVTVEVYNDLCLRVNADGNTQYQAQQ
jgi:predicted HD superfamily hydrolase involved in NAD metabolism